MPKSSVSQVQIGDTSGEAKPLQGWLSERKTKSLLYCRINLLTTHKKQFSCGQKLRHRMQNACSAYRNIDFTQSLLKLSGLSLSLLLSQPPQYVPTKLPVALCQKSHTTYLETTRGPFTYTMV